jgi:hypothetical protein
VYNTGGNVHGYENLIDQNTASNATAVGISSFESE